MAARAATLPKAGAGTVSNAPQNAPMAVRAPPARKMEVSGFKGERGKCQGPIVQMEESQKVGRAVPSAPMELTRTGQCEGILNRRGALRTAGPTCCFFPGALG